MATRVRNHGRPGVAAMAMAAVDVALWDLKARLLEQPLARLLGLCRDAVPIYGSGGFTPYNDRQLAQQLGGWVERGISQVKMKVGREPERDPVKVARRAVGPSTAAQHNRRVGCARGRLAGRRIAARLHGRPLFRRPLKTAVPTHIALPDSAGFRCFTRRRYACPLQFNHRLLHSNRAPAKL